MSSGNDDQKSFWEKFGAQWVTHQTELDAVFAPVLAEMLNRADLKPGQRVLDIGCGTGTSSLCAAKIVGPAGHVLGVDIAAPMLDRARHVAQGVDNVHFLTADAAEYCFEPEGFDAVVSRFGVMFFSDPVAAFKNIRRAMKPGARLTMASWSTLDANPWFRVPMYAAKKRLGAPPPMDPDAPGPLAFRDIGRVTGILDAAGFSDVSAQALSLAFTPMGDAAAVARQASTIGPAARTMEHFEGTDADFEAISADVAEAFAAYDMAEGVRIPALINFFSASAPAR
jgi:SAM-dependent methyltransferase